MTGHGVISPTYPAQEVTICLRRRDRFLSMVEPIVSPGRPLFGEKKCSWKICRHCGNPHQFCEAHLEKTRLLSEINSRTFRNLEVVIYNTSVVLREGVKLAGKL